MAVSKIAVMALVGILAVPILLGYALNLSEVTETEYKPDGEPVNVTQLLQNGSAYGYIHANAYTINTNFMNGSNVPITPLYNTRTTAQTSLYLEQWYGGTPGNIPPNLNFADFVNIYVTIIDADVNNYVRVSIDMNVTGVHVYDRLKSISYNDTSKTLTVGYTNSSDVYLNDIFDVSSDTTINTTYTAIGSFNGRFYQSWEWKNDSLNTSNNWVSLSGGFKLFGSGNYVKMPKDTKYITFTMDLSTMVDNRIVIASVNENGDGNTPAFDITKYNDGRVEIHVNNWSGQQIVEPLYYDPDRAQNVYQFTLSKELISTESNNGINQYTAKNYISADYVGDWPALIGKANSYWHYEYTDIYTHTSSNYIGFIGGVKFNTQTVTPTIRFDDAYYNGVAYKIIEDQTYRPSSFRTNPTTTITNVQKYGYSLEFGGNSYIVDSTGNIMLGTHKTSIDGLKLESVPVPVGYENRINGNVVSVSNNPSEIRFNGQWLASVSTDGNTATTYTKTEWNAGKFAWDGMDTNFLIVGLITCLGSFVALGIYVRKSGKGMIPLLIVCGCCAGLFFCMI